MTPSERKKIVKDFFDKAEAKNLIIYKDRSQFSEITKRIIKERQEEAQTFLRYKQSQTIQNKSP